MLSDFNQAQCFQLLAASVCTNSHGHILIGSIKLDACGLLNIDVQNDFFFNSKHFK